MTWAHLEGKLCKLVSDGTTHGTKLLTPDGVPIPFIQKLSIEFDAGTSLPVVKLQLLAEMDVNAVVNSVKELSLEEFTSPVYAVGSLDPLHVPK
jgi:hypothetical protein